MKALFRILHLLLGAVAGIVTFFAVSEAVKNKKQEPQLWRDAWTHASNPVEGEQIG